MTVYTCTAAHNQSISFGSGSPIKLKANETWTTTSACEMLAFIVAVDGAVGEDTVDVSELHRDWEIEQKTAAGPTPPVKPQAGTPTVGGAVTDGSADAPAIEPDNGYQLGVPRVKPSGVTGTTQHDRRTPVPPEKEQRRPPAGQEHPTRSGQANSQRNEAAQPVDPFSCAYLILSVDLEVPTPELPLWFVRAGRRVTYHSDHDIENLAEVRTPPTDNFPDGEATFCAYDHPNQYQGCRHNIVRVLNRSGMVVLANEPCGAPDFINAAIERIVKAVSRHHLGRERRCRGLGDTVRPQKNRGRSESDADIKSGCPGREPAACLSVAVPPESALARCFQWRRSSAPRWPRACEAVLVEGTGDKPHGPTRWRVARSRGS